MRHPELPILNIIGLVAVLAIIPGHWRARNVATLALIFWLAVANLTYFVNAVAWAGNVIDWAPVWCDISAHLQVASNWAVPLCSFTQMRRLESVASTRRVGLSQTERRRRIYLEIFLCCICPCIGTAFRLLAEGHRYNLVENIGCQAAVAYTWILFVTYYVPILLISGGACVYAALAIRWFLLRRLQFTSILSSSGSGLTTGRYLRLIALAVTDSAIVFIALLYFLIARARTTDLAPVSSISALRTDFQLVWQVTENESDQFEELYIGSYLWVIYSLVFFFFFGFGDEAVKEYVEAWKWVLRKMSLGRKDLVQYDLDHLPKLGSTSQPVERRAPHVGDVELQSESTVDGGVDDVKAGVKAPGGGIFVSIHTLSE